MGKVPNVIFAVLGTAFALCADAPLPGDARKGLEVFREQRCVTCHSVNGQGGKSAPDLGRKIGRSYTPDEMAGLMWNHAPAMWSAMEKAGVPRPQLTSEQASDLFAYFFAARYFEKPGDAARGRQVFVSKHCAECHNLTGAPSGGAPPVTAWQSLGDPILLAEGMWNHSANMSAAMERKRVSWPHMTGQEMTDLLVYLQNLPQMKGVQPQFSPASAETGKTLFEVKGCAGCHKDISKFAAAPGNPRSLGDFAAGMWNHAPPCGALNRCRRSTGRDAENCGLPLVRAVLRAQGEPHRRQAGIRAEALRQLPRLGSGAKDSGRQRRTV